MTREDSGMRYEMDLRQKLASAAAVRASNGGFYVLECPPDWFADDARMAAIHKASEQLIDMPEGLTLRFVAATEPDSVPPE